VLRETEGSGKGDERGRDSPLRVREEEKEEWDEGGREERPGAVRARGRDSSSKSRIRKKARRIRKKTRRTQEKTREDQAQWGRGDAIRVAAPGYQESRPE
jgi:hypothetical protein